MTTPFPRGSRGLITALLASSVVLSAALLGAAGAPTFTDQTASFEAVRVTRQPGGGATVALRNRAGKAITALTLGWRPRPDALQRVTEDLIQNAAPPHRLGPGEIIVEDVPWKADALEVIAVVFEDGTGSGDGSMLETIAGWREGTKAELGAVAQLIREAVIKPDPLKELRLASRGSAPSAGDAQSGSRPAGVATGAADSGAQRVRERFRYDLATIEASPDPVKATQEVLHLYEAQIARLHAPTR